ncbi:hypothetical protein PM082_018406 [Marasmius tenuissimus]|nr:hypothetical protein PM082_018406 [Marasmius tenuissimus]
MNAGSQTPHQTQIIERMQTDVKYFNRQPYQSRQISKDINMELDKGFYVGDIFYRGEYGWVYMGENEGDCRWRKFRRGEERRIVCPMEAGGHLRVLNTHKFVWVVEKDYLHNRKRSSLKPTKRTQTTRKTRDEDMGVYDEDVDMTSKSDEDSESRAKPVPQTHASRKIKPRQSIQTQRRETPHDEGQESRTRVLRPRSMTNGKRKGFPEQADSDNDDIGLHGSPRKKQKGAPPQVVASSTAIGRRGLASRLRIERHIDTSEEDEEEGQAAPSGLQQKLSRNGVASGGRNARIAELLSDADTSNCHPSLSESLHRWGQWVSQECGPIPYFQAKAKEAPPTHVKICDNLQANVVFSIDLLLHDLFECHNKGLTFPVLESADGPLHLKNPADSTKDLTRALMFPETSFPLAALWIPPTDSGLGKLELQFPAAYSVYGEDKPRVVHNPSADATSYTPKGYSSCPRINPMDMVVYHCHGRCLWLVYPHTLQNIATMSRSPGQKDDPRKPKPLEEWMAQMEGAEAILAEDLGTTFIVPAGTTYASISLSPSVHISGLVISGRNLEFSRLSDPALLDRSHPAAMAWASFLRDEGFLDKWECEGRKWLNEVDESLESPALRKAFPDFRSMENDPAPPQSRADNIGALDMSAMEGSLPHPEDQNGTPSTADDELLPVDDVVMSPEGNHNDSLDRIRSGKRKGRPVSASGSSDSDTLDLQVLSFTSSVRQAEGGNKSKRRSSRRLRSYRRVVEPAPPREDVDIVPLVVWASVHGEDTHLGKTWTKSEANRLEKEFINWASMTKVYGDDKNDIFVREFLHEVRTDTKHPARPHLYVHERQIRDRNWEKPLCITFDEWMECPLRLLQLGANVEFADQNVVFQQVRDKAGQLWDKLQKQPESALLVLSMSLHEEPLQLVSRAFRTGLRELECAGVKVWPDVTLMDFLANKEVFPLLLAPAVLKAGGSVYQPVCFTNSTLTTDKSLVEANKSSMVSTIKAALDCGHVVKGSVGSNHGQVILPKRHYLGTNRMWPLSERAVDKKIQEEVQELVEKHFADWCDAREEDASLSTDCFPVLFAVPYNPMLTNKGEVRVSFVDGRISGVHHTYPTPPGYWESGCNQERLTINAAHLNQRLKPVDEITADYWDPRKDEDANAWLGMAWQQGSKGYDAVTHFARAIYDQVVELEFRLQKQKRISGEPVSLRHRGSLVHVRIDVGVVFEGDKNGLVHPRFQLHEVQEGCCGLFRGTGNSSGSVAVSVAEILYTWLRSKA